MDREIITNADGTVTLIEDGVAATLDAGMTPAEIDAACLAFFAPAASG